MGSQTLVYGYIETDPVFDAKNTKILQSWEFDDVYPFSCIFSYPTTGHESSVISFGGSFKSLQEDWHEWERKFNDLIRNLYCRSAKLHVVDELDGEQLVLEYVCVDGWRPEISPDQRRWRKWRVQHGGTERREEIM